MTEKKSLLAELIERRIPQILGVYIATVWLAVEVSEWMSERFDVPVQTSSYVFVIMIAFVPLVALLAWGHGRPGKDKWTQKQLLFIPFNIALAWFAVTNFISPTEDLPESQVIEATEMMALTDVQTGEVVEYEVAKSGMSQNVTGFFWANKTGDESLDWLSYGSMWMVAKDLMRNPIIAIKTPYEAPSVMRRLISKKGSERAVNDSLSLNLDIAGDRDSQWMIKGEITREAEQLTFVASLYDVVTGALVTTITSSYDDWLFALDDVAEQLGKIILDKANITPSIIPERPLSEHISNNLSAIESVVGSLNAVLIDNDFATGVKLLESALSEDEELAEAYVLMLDYYRGLGDFEAAKKAAESALQLEYKLSQESVMKVKANYYAINGEQSKTIKVLENWVKLSPESADALQALGSNYILVGNRLDDALEVYKKLSELQDSDAEALYNQARIYRLKDNKKMALEALQIYAQRDPDKAKPLLEMAATYMQFGDLNAAKEKYEEASLISINGISADLGLAKIMAFEGDIDLSLQSLDRLYNKADTDTAKVEVLTEKEVILSGAGRLREALDVVRQAKVVSQSFLPPMAQNLMYGSKETAYLAYLGDFDGSWDLLKEMKAETKPPFDQILLMLDKTIYELTENDAKLAETLDQFESFVENDFETDIYDQFILDGKAVLARNKGDFDLAISLHNRAIKESRQSFLTLNSLQVLDDLMLHKAETLFDMEQFNEAMKTLESVLKRDPLNGAAQILQARILQGLNKLPEAKEVIAQLKITWVNADSEHKHLAELREIEAQLAEA